MKLGELLRKITSANFSSESKKPLSGIPKRVWTYKLSRYVTYCFNGGLCGKRFSF